MLSFDRVCDPVSMFQDTFSLSEFILGPFEEDCSDDNIGEMMKTEQEIKNEVIMNDAECQEPASDIYQCAQTPQYSPCSYQYQPVEPTSPSWSSDHSAASPTPIGFQIPCTYSNVANNSAGSITNNTPYVRYVGCPGRKPRFRDEELPMEEREKRRIRRERNKLAALRCRTRRRERIEELEKETEDLKNENNTVRSEISCLQAQLRQLQQMLAEHKCEHNI